MLFFFQETGMSETVTIYDVARAAGVSPATVSRVMNEPSKVAQEKRQRVLDCIRELHFVPKADAVINARKAYKKIGVVAPFFTQTSFLERLRGIATVLTPEHYELVMYSIDSNEDLENYISTLITANRVDGLIFLCVHLDSRMLSLLSRSRFPVCFVEDPVDGFDSVIVRNLEGGQKAAEHLYSKGCRRPCFIGEKSNLPYAVRASEDRFQGFKFYFANQGILIDEKYVWMGEFTEQKLDEGIFGILSQNPLPDGVFCSSDLIAARFVALAREKGIRIGTDIKVLGFDDIDIASYIGLSSVSQNLDESGRAAAQLILSPMEHKANAVTNIMLPLTVIERQTTN